MLFVARPSPLEDITAEIAYRTLSFEVLRSIPPTIEPQDYDPTFITLFALMHRLHESWRSSLKTKISFLPLGEVFKPYIQAWSNHAIRLLETCVERAIGGDKVLMLEPNVFFFACSAAFCTDVFFVCVVAVRTAIATSFAALVVCHARVFV